VCLGKPGEGSDVPREYYSVSEAAKMLGISLDTLRRWDRAGRISTERDSSNRRLVRSQEIDRLRGDQGSLHLSARNRFNGIVTDVKVDGLVAQVEVIVSDPVRLTALVTRDAIDELQLRPGMAVTAIVKSTSVMVQHYAK